MRDGCEKIQRYGKKENEDGSPETDEKLCLQRITQALSAVREDYREAETALKRFYEIE